MLLLSHSPAVMIRSAVCHYLECNIKINVHSTSRHNFVLTVLQRRVRIEINVAYIAAVVYTVSLSGSYINENKPSWHIHSVMKSLKDERSTEP